MLQPKAATQKKAGISLTTFNWIAEQSSRFFFFFYILIKT